MLTNHLRAAWRHFRREKGVTAINIFGLTLGATACIFILLYVIDELSYDRYNVKANRIFRIASDLHINGGTINAVATPFSMSTALVHDFPAVENAVRIRAVRTDVAIHVGDNVFLQSGTALADSSLFDIFTLPMLYGDPRTALKAPNSIVLTATTAKRYFNTTDVVGRTLTLDQDTALCKITGVISDFPAESHFHFPLIRSMQQHRVEWINFYSATYILARPGITEKDIDRMLTQIVVKYIDPAIKQQLHTGAAELKRNGDRFRFYAIPLTRIHLYSNIGQEFEVNGNIQYVILFMGVAVLILIVACINFVNLSIARSIRRMREIGVKKLMGSGRTRLAAQFLVESIGAAAIAMTLALIFVVLLLPFFDQLTGKAFDASFLLSPWTIPVFTGATIIVGLLSGGYPAFLLSGVDPLAILRGQTAMGLRAGALRTGLLVFQFSTAIILLISTGVIYSQLYYIRHRALGYSREQVVTVKDTRSLGDKVWTFANETRRIPGVESVTVSGFLPDQKVVFRGFFKDPSGSETATALLADWQIDANYLPTLGMQIATGRNFSADMPTDSGCVLINETAARVLGYVHPLGEYIYTGPNVMTPYRIIGVVKDFNTGSLRNPIDPVVFRLARDGSAVTMRIKPQDIAGTLKSIRAINATIAGGQPFVYSFLDDDFSRLYTADQRTGSLAAIFSLLAVFIAGMGMFGLVAAASEQRTKELGVRRVLGARLNHLIKLLLKEYSLPITLAIGMALPTGAWLMHSWLRGFAYRTGLQPWIFITAPLCAIVLAFLIVGAKAGQTTRVNLAKTLRTE
ncbi:MAG TPA: ABC transporter permease [Puia sp.]|nr:ABC transporter permease [Puia sp.]